ncbi:MAG: Gfo/Idh/MocA family oxidoreductase [Victivallaceae bacterium]|nr:Gfo/Idh/MocA family oxidoreductase [Victivallaceae bacterium]
MVRIGLVGLGFMGTTHFGIYSKLPNAKVVAIADVDAAKRSGDISAVSGNLGDGSGSKLDLSGIACYDDAAKLIADPSVDVVDICVPTPFHAKTAIAALEAGKNVFCEKPLCLNRDELNAIVAAVKQSKKAFNLGLCVRAWPEYRHAYELYKSGAIGKVRSAVFKRISPSVAGNAWDNWYMKGDMSHGALLDLHMHDCDQIRYFFGRPKSVSAAGARGIVSDHGIDHVYCSYDFGDGTLIAAEGGWAPAKGTPFEMSFTIVCEKATLKLDASGYHVYYVDGTSEAPQVADSDLPTGWHQELSYFVDCIERGVDPDKYQNIDEIADSYAMILAEEESVDTKKTVEVRYV